MNVLFAAPSRQRPLPALAALEGLSSPLTRVGLDALAFVDNAGNSVCLLDFRSDSQEMVEFAGLIRQLDVSMPLIGVFGADRPLVISATWGLSDFVLDTISARELQARLDRAAQRIGPPASHDPVVVLPDGGLLRLDTDSPGVHLAGRYVPLTVAEFQVFQILVTEPGRVFRRAELVPVWEARGTPTMNAVTIVILRIRRKLGDHAGLVRTVRGVGYQFAVDRPAASRSATGQSGAAPFTGDQFAGVDPVGMVMGDGCDDEFVRAGRHLQHTQSVGNCPR